VPLTCDDEIENLAMLDMIYLLMKAIGQKFSLKNNSPKELFE
jgi:hypothetical protein